MSKFIVFSCSNVKPEDTGHDYHGNVAILACCQDPSLMLFFPVSDENARMLSFVLDEDSEFDINTSTIGIYQTMINSWKASGRFLSGIVMDMAYDPEIKDEVMSVKLALSTKYGALDCVVKVNFVHAIMLSVMEGLEIIVTDELLRKLMPSDGDEYEGEYEEESDRFSSQSNYPKDENILNIVKGIMEAEEKPITKTPTKTTKTTTKKPPRKRISKTNKDKDNKKDK